MQVHYREYLRRMIEWSTLIPTLCLIIINLQLGASIDGVGCPVGIKITVVYNALVWPEQDWGLLIKSHVGEMLACDLGCCVAYTR